MIRSIVRYIDSRAGAAPLFKKALRYVFPDHWSFLLGEIALYAFVVLVATGVYLTFFFEPSLHDVVYRGGYGPLYGLHMSEAYRSVVDLSFQTKAGLLMRQTHHWAADVFIVAIVLHVLRVFFTGAFRKPRDLVWIVGVLMLALALVEGFLGYSLVDDLLSGMGLAIAYSVVMGIPIVGANLALLLWGGPYPGIPSFEARMYLGHVLLLPLLIGTLLLLHIALIAARHHTQFPGPRRSEARVVGRPAFPGFAPRSLGLCFAVTSVLFLLGGLVQINPVWQWGPYDVAQGTNGAQPDWYLGWLIGGLRLMPGFDVTIGGWTLIPNVFWAGAALPLFVFGVMIAWPAVERRLAGDHGYHNLLDRPRDSPLRTATGAAFLTWVACIFFAGASDRVFVNFDVPYTSQVWFWRVALFVLPVIIWLVTRRVCEELRAEEPEPSLGEALDPG